MDGFAALEPNVEPDGALARVAKRYAVAITPAMRALIDPADPADPIAAQFMPDARELFAKPNERADPIGDDAHTPCEGVVRRYEDRCLLKVIAVCPVYCRFCFRRESVGPMSVAGKAPVLSADALARALAYIAQQTDIWEVILTGGDPFLLSPRRMRSLTARLAAIPHVKILRWHTRVPAVDPTRVTDDLVAALKAAAATAYVVLHVNHPRELTREACAAIARLVDAGVPLLSQSVLLKGVNDNAEILESLFRRLVEERVKPYYLHHGDLAPGTSHLRTPIETGQNLMQMMQARVSGLCQPTYVLDIPGGHGKAPLTPCAAEKNGDGWRLRGRDGVWRDYEDHP